MSDTLLNTGYIPGAVYRSIIHHRIKQGLKVEKKRYQMSQGDSKRVFIDQLKNSPIALSTSTANEQHYEVPSAFFQYVLGPQLKYSCCDYSEADQLANAETAMLKLTCERADIQDGQNILDLGCGWGSLTCYLAEHYPNATITAVSNSATQQALIQERLKQRQLKPVQCIKTDVNDLKLTEKYDRIVSIELFEHVRNYQQLFNHLNQALKPQGILFVHHFCHQYLTYAYDPETSWMAKHFFADGIMPSEDLLMFFDQTIPVEQRWQVNGTHYAKTCQDWLANLHNHRQAILELFAQHYDKPRLQYEKWELFFRACEQLFAWDQGHEWFVSHYRFRKP